MVQYKTNVLWDPTLCSINLVEDTAITRAAGIAGLAQFAIKLTSGAPATIAGRWLPGAIVQNAVTAIDYKMDGTTASPHWAVIDTATGGLPPLANGEVWIGNGSNVATPHLLSGDISMTNAGATTVAKWQGNTVTMPTPSAGDVPQWNGSAWVNGAVVPSPLPSGDIFVGNGSNVATARTMTGDISISNTGVTTYLGQKVFQVQKILNRAAINGLGTSAVQVVAATGNPNEAIIPLSATMAYTFNSAAFATHTGMSLIHAGSTVEMFGTDIGQGSSTFARFKDSAQGVPAAGNNIIANADLNLFVLSGNPTGGGAASQIIVTVLYTVLTIL